MNDLKALGSRLHPRWFLAPIGALIAAGLSIVAVGIPVWLAWLTTEHGTSGARELFDLVGSAWLAVQDVPMNSGAVHYSIMPWGLVVIPIFCLYRSGRLLGRSAQRTSRVELAIVLLVAALVYAAVMALVAQLTATPGLHAPIAQAAITGFVIALVTTAVALARTTDVGKALVALVPKGIWTVVRGGAAGALGLLGAGAVLALISLIWHFWQAREILEFLDAGVFGGLLVTVACIGYLPVLILWALAYLLGPGIAIGPGIGISPFMPTPPPTELPALPLLAALPERVGALAWGLPVVAVIIGIGVGITCVRGGPLPALLRLATATAASIVTGVVIGLLSSLAQGSLGDVRLLNVGPDAVSVGLLAFGLTAIGAIPTALALRTAKPTDAETELGEQREQPRDKYYNVDELVVAEEQTPVVAEASVTGKNVPEPQAPTVDAAPNAAGAESSDLESEEIHG